MCEFENVQFIELKVSTASVRVLITWGSVVSNFVLYEKPIRALMFITMIFGSFSCLSWKESFPVIT